VGVPDAIIIRISSFLTIFAPTAAKIVLKLLFLAT